MKHVGKITNTDKRCVVVCPRLPGAPDKSLVVDTDALPDSLHQALMGIVEGEGQMQPKLDELLSRRMMPDTRLDVLNTLHQRGHLQTVSVDNLSLTPRPNIEVPMRDVVAHMTIDENMRSPIPEATNPTMDPRDVASMYEENQNITQDDNRLAVANGLIFEARLLEEDARKKREEAYNMAPELRENTSTPREDTQSSETPAKRKRGRPKKTESS